MLNIPEAKLEDLRGTPTENVLARGRVLALFSRARKVEFMTLQPTKFQPLQSEEPYSLLGGVLLIAAVLFGIAVGVWLIARM